MNFLDKEYKSENRFGGVCVCVGGGGGVAGDQGQ